MAAETRQSTTEPIDTEHLLAPLQQFAMALALYFLWGGIAWLSALAGQLRFSEPGALILLAGVAATNALSFSLARARAVKDLPAEGLAVLHSVLGICWATLFLVVTTGGNQLSMGMFTSAMLYALFQLQKRAFIYLAAGSVVAFAAATAARWLLHRGDWQPELLNLVTYLGVTGWLMVFANYLADLRQRLRERNLELQQHIQKVVRIAERDQLTKSFNRHAIMDTLSREKGRADRTGTPVSVCILDLDHFKALNDAHGHLIGDRVLRQFAKRARAELRTMDVVQPCGHRRSLGRFGGEEFVAILPGTTLGSAVVCADRMRACIADEPFDGLYRVTVSVGVAEYQRGETVHDWLARADDALYRAKAEGRDRVALSGTPTRLEAEVYELRPAR